MERAPLGIFVQARLGSQRLRGKALLPLGGSTVIGQVMRSLRHVPASAHALLTDAESAALLQGPAREEGFALHVGPAEDVLRRYADAARGLGVRTVVRATGDSPLVSPELTVQILREHEEARADLSHYLGCPLGTGVEVIGVEALLEADRLAREPVEREHMTTYLYRHRERFRIHEPRVRPELERLNANVSVDTQADYERVRLIYGDLYRGVPVEVADVVRWLTEHPEQVAVKHISY